jgi:hypothetical protein
VSVWLESAVLPEGHETNWTLDPRLNGSARFPHKRGKQRAPRTDAVILSEAKDLLSSFSNQPGTLGPSSLRSSG